MREKEQQPIHRFSRRALLKFLPFGAAAAIMCGYPLIFKNEADSQPKNKKPEMKPQPSPLPEVKQATIIDDYPLIFKNEADSQPENKKPEMEPQPSSLPEAEQKGEENKEGKNRVEINTIAKWEEQGEIPASLEEWERTISIFDDEMETAGLKSIYISEKPSPFSPREFHFWPLLSPKEQQKWIKWVETCGKPIESYFVERFFETDEESQFPVKPTGFLLKIPSLNMEEGQPENSILEIIKGLPKKEIFELGTMLNLLNLRTQRKKESIGVSSYFSFTGAWGFQSITEVGNEEGVMHLDLSIFDTLARLYILSPHLPEIAPRLTASLSKTLPSDFDIIMRGLAIKPEAVELYYKTGDLINFLKEIGEKIEEREIIIDRKGQNQDPEWQEWQKRNQNFLSGFYLFLAIEIGNKKSLETLKEYLQEDGGNGFKQWSNI